MTAPLPEREAADEPRTATAGEPDAPRRVLVVSADMGGGHNATADALEEAVERRSGLAWLRSHRGLAVPTGCWISDFAPHPFWVYGELDASPRRRS